MYLLPLQGTTIIPCLELCHKDPAFWEKPNEFYPERFIDKDGKLDGKKDYFVAFSVGNYKTNKISFIH